MRTHQLTLRALLLLLGVSGMSHAADLSCKNIPVVQQVPATSNLIEISYLGLAFGDKASTSLITVRNTGTEPIQDLVLLIEFLDQNNNFLLSVPFHSVSAHYDMRQSPDDRFFGDNLGLPKVPLKPMQSATLAGMTSLFRKSCPAQAKVSFAEVVTGGMPHKSIKKSDWDFQPTLSHARPLDLSAPPFRFPLYVLADITVSQEGKVTDLVLPEKNAARLTVWLKPQLTSWVFLPALRRGIPVESTITLLFRFVQSKAQFDSDWFHLLPNQDRLYGVVDVVPYRPFKTKGSVSIAGNDLTVNDPELNWTSLR